MKECQLDLRSCISSMDGMTNVTGHNRYYCSRLMKGEYTLSRYRSAGSPLRSSETPLQCGCLLSWCCTRFPILARGKRSPCHYRASLFCLFIGVVEFILELDLVSVLWEFTFQIFVGKIGKLSMQILCIALSIPELCVAECHRAGSGLHLFMAPCPGIKSSRHPCAPRFLLFNLRHRDA